MKVINKTFCGEQDGYIFEYVANSQAELPTSGIAYGSIAFLPDGIYCFFESTQSWTKIN